MAIVDLYYEAFIREFMDAHPEVLEALDDRARWAIRYAFTHGRKAGTMSLAHGITGDRRYAPSETNSER